MATKQKYLVTVGYMKLAFDKQEDAMRVYALLAESTPVTFASCYPSSPPESMKNIEYVRDSSNAEIELKRVDGSRFALHMTDEEFKEKCKPQPTEVDGEARLIADQHVPSIEAPADVEDVTDVEFL